MEDVNDKLDWVAGKLGGKHPAVYHINETRGVGFAKPFKLVDPTAKKLSLADPDPEFVERSLQPLVADPAEAADSIGHIEYGKMVETYTDCAVKAKKKSAARAAQTELVSLFKKRKVVPEVIKKAEARLKKLK